MRWPRGLHTDSILALIECGSRAPLAILAGKLAGKKRMQGWSSPNWNSPSPDPARKLTTGGGGLVGRATNRRLRSGKSRKLRSPGRHEFQGKTVQESLDRYINHLRTDASGRLELQGDKVVAVVLTDIQGRWGLRSQNVSLIGPCALGVRTSACRAGQIHAAYFSFPKGIEII